MQYILGDCRAGRPTHDPSSVFWLTEAGSRPRPLAFRAAKASCTLRKKQPETITFTRLRLSLVMVFIISLPPNTQDDARAFRFQLTIAVSPKPSLYNLDVSKRACTFAFLSRGTLQALQDFGPLRHSGLPVVFLGTVVLIAFRSLTSSFSVVQPHTSWSSSSHGPKYWLELQTESNWWSFYVTFISM